jgi:hypothetical protein
MILDAAGIKIFAHHPIKKALTVALRQRVIKVRSR